MAAAPSSNDEACLGTHDSGVVKKMFDCPPRERLRRAFVVLVVAGVIYVPAIVTFTMLVTGNA